MTHIHYKFSSKLSYATVVFDGPHVTLTDLKEEIMGRERLRAGDCELQITDAQTKEEYTNEEGLIPKGSSVIVKRVPNMKVKSGSVKKIQITERSDAHSHVASGDIKAWVATQQMFCFMCLAFAMMAIQLLGGIPLDAIVLLYCWDTNPMLVT